MRGVRGSPFTGKESEEWPTYRIFPGIQSILWIQYCITWLLCSTMLNSNFKSLIMNNGQAVKHRLWTWHDRTVQFQDRNTHSVSICQSGCIETQLKKKNKKSKEKSETSKFITVSTQVKMVMHVKRCIDYSTAQCTCRKHVIHALHKCTRTLHAYCDVLVKRLMTRLCYRTMQMAEREKMEWTHSRLSIPASQHLWA